MYGETSTACSDRVLPARLPVNERGPNATPTGATFHAGVPRHVQVFAHAKAHFLLYTPRSNIIHIKKVINWRRRVGPVKAAVTAFAGDPEGSNNGRRNRDKHLKTTAETRNGLPENG